MKVILYFGHHKVGSTALQAFFAQNMLPLAKQGILYPAVETQGLSYLLKQALTGQDTATDLSCMNLREPHNALAFRMLANRNKRATPPWHGTLPPMPAMLRAIQHQIAVFDPHTVILCSEVFANFGPQHPDLITLLHKQFPGAEIELYCALRRPDDYMISWFGQRLRFGQKLASLSGGTALKDTQTIHFNYKKMVAPWVQTFPDARLHLRNYADILAAGGSVEDFTTQVGCTFPDRLSQKGPKNTGLPRGAFELLRRANHDLPSKEAQALLNLFLGWRTLPSPIPDKEVELFGADLRQKLYENFLPIDAYLGNLIGQDHFFPDLDAIRQAAPLPETEATQALLNSVTAKWLMPAPARAYLQTLKQDL